MTSLVLMILIGCGLHGDLRKGADPNNLYKHTASIYTTPKQDTPRTKDSRTMTPKQLEYFIAQQYQANYTKFFAPEFKRLNGVVDKQSTVIQDQANSLRVQAGYLITYRKRMDSIAHERNAYRDGQNKAQDSQVYWQKQAIASQKQLIKVITQQSKDNKNQVDANTLLSICCLIGVVIIALLFLYLLYRIRSISKRVDGLLEHQSNV